MGFLGVQIHGLSSISQLPKAKLAAKQMVLSHFLTLSYIFLCHVARIVEILPASVQAVFLGPLHCRPLQWRMYIIFAKTFFTKTQFLETSKQNILVAGPSPHLEQRAFFNSAIEILLQSDAFIQLEGTVHPSIPPTWLKEHGLRSLPCLLTVWSCIQTPLHFRLYKTSYPFPRHSLNG